MDPKLSTDNKVSTVTGEVYTSAKTLSPCCTKCTVTVNKCSVVITNYQTHITISYLALHNYYAASSTKHLEDSCDAAQLHLHETSSTLTTLILLITTFIFMGYLCRKQTQVPNTKKM
jgi:hypothetical protein